MRYLKILSLMSFLVSSGILLFSDSLDHKSSLSILYPAVMIVTLLFFFSNGEIVRRDEITFKPTITRILLVGLFVYHFSKNGYFEGFDTFTFLTVASMLALLFVAVFKIEKHKQ